MPVYNTLRTLALSPGSSTGEPLRRDFWTLYFPQDWKEPLRRLSAERAGKPIERIGIPIDTLNRAMRALVPNLVSINKYAGRAREKPWLVSSQPIEPKHLYPIVHAWARAEFDGLGTERIKPVLDAMSADDLRWVHRAVDLDDWRQAPNGTAEPGAEDDLFTLLPNYLAARLAIRDLRFDLGPEPRPLLRVPGEAGARGAELVSWPPLVHTDRRGYEWPYSVVVRLTAQTVPFQPRPVVHCEVMLRRWAVLAPDARKGLYLPGDKDTSVYLRTSVPWLVEGDYTSCFQVAPIAWRGGAKWGGGLASLLERLTMRKRLPEPEELCQNPASYLNVGGAYNAAIVYRNGLRPKHGAEAGFMPVDREDIWEQVVHALRAIARPVDLLPRATYGIRAPKRAMGVVTPKDTASAEADVPDIAARQRALRTAVAEATGGALTLDLLYQNDPLRDSVVDQVRSSLGLGDPHMNGTGLAWDTEELVVTVDPRPLGAAGSPLELAAGRGGDRRRAAMRQRGDEVAALFAPDGRAAAAIVELGDAAHFESEPAADPKHAIRLGAAKAGRTSQFLGLHQPDDGQAGTNVAHRIEQAWRDTLRQIGVQTQRPIFERSYGPLPSPLNYVGVWLVARNRTGSPTGYAHQIPVMVWLASDTSDVRATAPGLGEWLPYREALLALTELDAFATGGREDTRVLRFIEETMRRDVAALGDVLLLTHAQNLRRAWPWLQNGLLGVDQLGFGPGTTERIEDWPGLRHVRVRVEEGGETPECFGERENGTGFPKGLWRLGEGDRVFGSTAAKPPTAKHLSARHSKLKVSRGAERDYPPQPGFHAWNPSLVELTVAAVQPSDDPLVWAALAHELRLAASHYNEATKLPLPLHLARAMDEYAIPMRPPTRL